MLKETQDKNDIESLNDTLIVLNLKSKIKIAWHNSPGSKVDRTIAVGEAIELFIENQDISVTKTKKWLKLLGFCLGDGEFYQNSLHKILKDNKELRVSLKDAKLSKAKHCLVHL